MALSTTVIVSGINNLSDARYCAGMGVDMLGFGFEEDHPNYLPPAQFKEISGWVAGVQMVGEFTGTDAEQINLISESYNLDLVQLEKPMLLSEINQLFKPVILKLFINKDTLASDLEETMEMYKNAVKYFLIYSNEFSTIDSSNQRLLTKLSEKYPVLIGFGLNSENVNEVLAQINPAGIGLQGGNEIRPGFKDFDELQDIFEVLEED